MGMCGHEDPIFSIFSVLKILLSVPNHNFLEISCSKVPISLIRLFQFQRLKLGQISVHRASFCLKKKSVHFGLKIRYGGSFTSVRPPLMAAQLY